MPTDEEMNSIILDIESKIPIDEYSAVLEILEYSLESKLMRELLFWNLYLEFKEKVN
jgi:hypothetical protein